MKITKKIILIISFILFVFIFSFSLFSQSVSGLVEIIDPQLNGKKLSSGSIYNPDENSCITSKYNMLTVLLLENIINGKKTIVYVIDTKPTFKFKDSILAISSRAAKELGETNNVQIAVKITILKEGTTSEQSQNEQTQAQQTQQTQEEQPIETKILPSQENSIPIFTSGKQTNKTFYYIQVGAFKNKDNAILVAQKLKDLGYKVFIYYKDLYKVIVGPYNKQDEAIEVKKILSNIFSKDQPFVFSSTILFE